MTKIWRWQLHNINTNPPGNCKNSARFDHKIRLNEAGKPKSKANFEDESLQFRCYKNSTS